MWPDDETELDFLNFSGVADTVAEIIVQAKGRPISIGVSGRWGVGKSSMIKLIRKSLADRTKDKDPNFVFVKFNAWLYQGYDDARAALMDVIASVLRDEAERRKTGVEKTKELLSRVNWFRVAKIGAGSAISLALGVPPTGLIGEILEIDEPCSGCERIIGIHSLAFRHGGSRIEARGGGLRTSDRGRA